VIEEDLQMNCGGVVSVDAKVNLPKIGSPLRHAGTVLKLGTKKHHDLLVGQIDSLSATGCFALTELGFGALLPCLRLLLSGASRQLYLELKLHSTSQLTSQQRGIGSVVLIG